MKDIASQVNLTAASLYHHFESKDFLLLSVLESGMELALDRILAEISDDMSLPRASQCHDPQPCP